MTDNTDVAAAWLQSLAARGVRVAIRNGRLRLHPEAAYKELTDDEHATLRHHRGAIKAFVAAGGLAGRAGSPAAPALAQTPPTLAQDARSAVGAPGSPSPTPAATGPEPKPEPICPFCMRPCVGREHEAFATLHARDEAEIWRRRAEERERDGREYELRRLFGRPSSLRLDI